MTILDRKRRHGESWERHYERRTPVYAPSWRTDGDEQARDERGQFASSGAAPIDHAARETSFAKSLAPHEQDAVNEYSGRKYQAINRLARTGSIHPSKESGRPKSTEDPREIAGHVKSLDAALAKMEPTPRDMLVHRGSVAKELRDVKVGDVITDKGFMSTSADAATGHAFASGIHGGEVGTKISIHVPKGTKLSPLPTMLGEGEHLFPRNTSLRVTHSSKDERGFHVVHAEVVK